jgi:hypothetical protein
MQEWEQSLDSYDQIVTALETHAENLREVMESKHDAMQDKMSKIRLRLSALTNNTVNLEMLSKAVVKHLNSDNWVAGQSATEAGRLAHLFSGDLREAHRLNAVARDAHTFAKRCKNCIDNFSERGAQVSVFLLASSITLFSCLA